MNKIDIEPKVSIIIPLYNREKLIKRAIESVLVQSFTAFEVVFRGAHKKAKVGK